MNEISKDELMRGLLTQADLEGGFVGLAGDLSRGGTLSGLIPVYKKWGKTPLETLDELRQKYPVLEGVPLSYAGRLDPLAEGLMLILVGDTNKDREKYLGLDKTYEVEILFGIKTDTGDLFGVPTADSTQDLLKFSSNNSKEFEDDVAKVLKSFVGKQQFPYPAYSSKTVQGKPLFQWMNEGRIGEIEIPKTDVEIYLLESKNVQNPLTSVRGSEILEKVELALNSVKGDFRYDEIRAGWKSVLAGREGENFSVIKIICECSSGTYMRVLAEEIGKRIGVNKTQNGMPALAYSIKRMKIESLGLERVIV